MIQLISGNDSPEQNHQPTENNDDALLDAYSRTVTKVARDCLLYTSPSPRDQRGSRMPSSA